VIRAGRGDFFHAYYALVHFGIRPAEFAVLPRAEKAFVMAAAELELERNGGPPE